MRKGIIRNELIISGRASSHVRASLNFRHLKDVNANK